MPNFIKKCERTARKRHTCSYCEAYIEPGQKYLLQTLKYGGIVYEWKEHPECEFIAQELWSFIDPDDSGMSAEDFQQGCQDFCLSFVCPNCGRFDKEAEECAEDGGYCIHKIYDFLQANELVRAKKPGDWFVVWKCVPRVPDLPKEADQ